MTLGVPSFAASAHGAASAGPRTAPRASAEHSHQERGEPGDNVLSFELTMLEVLESVKGGSSAREPASAVGSHAEVVGHVGVAASFERALHVAGLAAELKLVLSPAEEGLSLPSELLVKRLFEPSPKVEPFVGLGVAAEWLAAGKYHPQYGVTSDVGSYFWLERRFGLVLETEYSLFFSRETAQEFALAAGGALRF